MDYQTLPWVRVDIQINDPSPDNALAAGCDILHALAHVTGIDVAYMTFKRRFDFTCDECKGDVDMVILHDRLWETIARRDELLCVTCIEARLGRSLRISDLKDCGITRHAHWIRSLEE